MLSKKSIVIAALLQEISEGKIAPGEFIPSRNQLMRRFHCSRTVVENAISSLTAQGILAGKQGKGTFLCHPPHARSETLRKINVISPYDAKSFSSAMNCVQFDINDFGLPVEVISPARAEAESELLAAPDALNFHINPGFQQLSLLHYLKARNSKQIIINREFDGFDRIYTDTLTGFRQSLELLETLPGNKICLLAHQPEILFPYQTPRLSAFFRVCTERKLAIAPENIQLTPFGQTEIPPETVKNFFRQLPVKIAILNQDLALPLLQTARLSGVTPGKEFSLLIFDYFNDFAQLENTILIRQRYDLFYETLKDYVRNFPVKHNGNFISAIPPEVIINK